MLHKRILRFLSTFLLVLVCCSVFACAAYPRESPRISFASAELIKNGSDLYVCCNIHSNDKMDKIGVSSIQIECYNGSSWVTEKTLTPSSNPNMLVSNANTYYDEFPYSPNYSGSPYRYRAIVTFYAEKDNGVSTRKVTTNPM